MNIEGIETGVKQGFSRVKEELTEHLDAINQNTSELSTAYQYIAQLESHLEKLNERIDDLSIQVKGVTLPEYSIDLTLREQEVFLSLYMSGEPLSIEGIAKQLGLTIDLVGIYVNKLVNKGVPLVRQTINNLTFFALESSFKSIQAQRSIVPLSETVVAQFN